MKMARECGKVRVVDCKRDYNGPEFPGHCILTLLLLQPIKPKASEHEIDDEKQNEEVEE